MVDLRLEFAHLHVHSWYSSVTGIASVAELVERAATLGYSALALTDDSTTAGIPEFVKECRQRAIKPIIGVELSVRWGSDAGILDDRLVLLAENDRGYANISSLVSLAYEKEHLPSELDRWGPGHRWIADVELADHTEGIIVLAGVQGSLLLRHLAHGQHREAQAYLAHLIRLFGQADVVLALEDAATSSNLKALATQYHLLTVVSWPVYYLAPPDRLAHLFVAGAPCPTSVDLTAFNTDGSLHHLLSRDELTRRFRHDADSVTATMRIVDRCRALTSNFQLRFPTLMLPRGCSAETYLWDQIIREATRHFPDLGQSIRTRLGTEYNYYVRAGLAERLILWHALVSFCRERGVTLGVGSGRWITSLVAYVLGITQIDPLRFPLNFAGILAQPGEIESSSFVLEVPPREAATVVEFFEKHFGPGRCCCVGRYQSLSRTALLRQISSWCRLGSVDTDLVQQGNRDALRPFSNFFRSASGTLNLPHPAVADFLLSRLLGRPHDFAPEEDELAISDDRLDHVVPVIPFGKLPTTLVDGTALDSLGIPRIKLSCPPLLAVLDSAVRAVREEEGPSFDAARIPLEDPRTYELLRRGLTLGIDPFQSVRMRMHLRRESPVNFLGVIRVRSALAQERGEKADVGHFLPECLLAFRVAYIKAHYPACFFAAALSTLATSRASKNLAPLLREARDMGVKILPPDINRSDYLFSVESNGVRVGLCVVHGLGEKTFRAIEDARNRGEFEDLVDLRRRVEARDLNNRILETLIQAGALDCFGLDRAQLLALLDQIAGSADLREAGLLSPDFEPQPPDVPSRTPREIVSDEIAVMGFPVSQDPLRLYGDVVRRCRARRAGDISPRKSGRDVTLVGYLNHLDEDPTTRDVAIDFDGYLLLVPHKVAEAYRPVLSSQEPVLVTGSVQQEKHTKDLYVRAYALFTLAQVAELAHLVPEIVLDLGGENLVTLRLLFHLMWAHRGGATRLTLLNVPDSVPARIIGWTLRRMKLFFSPSLYFSLCKILTQDQISLKLRDATPETEVLDLLLPFRRAKTNSLVSVESSEVLSASSDYVTRSQS